MGEAFWIVAARIGCLSAVFSVFFRTFEKIADALGFVGPWVGLGVLLLSVAMAAAVVSQASARLPGD